MTPDRVSLYGQILLDALGRGDWEQAAAAGQAIMAQANECTPTLPTAPDTGTGETARWPFGADSAARLIAATGNPNERVENRDSWAPRLITEPDILAVEAERARTRLEQAIALLSPTPAPDVITLTRTQHAAELREAKADALREAADEFPDRRHMPGVSQWLRERADRIGGES